jgi:tetratricopeptide (TPR) repeat protein
MFGLSVTGSTLFLWLSMGVLLSPSASTHDLRAPSWRAVGVGAVVALVLAGTVLNVRFIVADNHFLKGRVLTTGAASVTEIERAIELNPYNDMYRLELGAAWQDAFRSYAQQYAQQSGTSDPALEQNLVDAFGKAEAGYRDMIAFVPYEYDTYVFLANLYNEGATYINPAYADKAIEVGLIGTQVEPYGPAVRLQLAVAHTTKGQLAEAVKELEYAVELDPRYSQARLTLAQVYIDLGRTDDALAQYQAVLAAFPDNIQAQQGLEALEASMSAETTAP